jgi:hypothetical protein
LAASVAWQLKPKGDPAGQMNDFISATSRFPLSKSMRLFSLLSAHLARASLASATNETAHGIGSSGSSNNSKQQQQTKFM